jgi:hypothetical protein
MSKPQAGVILQPTIHPRSLSNVSKPIIIYLCQYSALVHSDVLGGGEYNKYCCNVSRIHQFKMQFKVIASVLLLFAAQTIMATPNPQPAEITCTLIFMLLR